MRRRIPLVVALVLGVAFAAAVVSTAFGSTGSSGRNADAAPLAVCLVTDTTGLVEHSFNALEADGLMRAVRELGVSGRVLESRFKDDYLPNLSQCAQDGSQLTIAAGFLLADATLQAALQYPASMFAIVDYDGYASWPPNLAGLVFNSQEAGYLAGYLAALMTKTGTISSVGGVRMGSVDSWIEGYQAGARAAKPDVVLLTDYSWDFRNQGMCNALALDQIARGSDVVFNVAGACGTGALAAAASKGVWGIGVDVDQSYLGDHILTSAVKNVDQAVFQTIQMTVDGRTLGGGTITFGFAEHGVGLGAISSAVPQPVLDQLDVLHMRPTIGAAKLMPGAIAGKRVTVTVPVTRSDNGNPLATGTLICDPTIAEKPIPHTEHFTYGTARITLTLPKKAKGKLLTLRLTIQFGGTLFTQIAAFRIR